MQQLHVIDQDTGKFIEILLDDDGRVQTDVDASIDIDQTTPGLTNRVVSGGTSKTFELTPTITLSGYSPGDAVGGLLHFENAQRIYNGGGWIDTVIIRDADKQLAALELVLFDGLFTATLDNAPFDPFDADLANCIGHIPIASGNYSPFKDNSEATVRDVGFRFSLSGTSMFGQLVTRGTPNYEAIDGITVALLISQD